jgi:hypothetical protein
MSNPVDVNQRIAALPGNDAVATLALVLRRQAPRSIRSASKSNRPGCGKR